MKEHIPYWRRLKRCDNTTHDSGPYPFTEKDMTGKTVNGEGGDDSTVGREQHELLDLTLALWSRRKIPSCVEKYTWKYSGLMGYQVNNLFPNDSDKYLQLFCRSLRPFLSESASLPQNCRDQIPGSSRDQTAWKGFTVPISQNRGLRPSRRCDVHSLFP